MSKAWAIVAACVLVSSAGSLAEEPAGTLTLKVTTSAAPSEASATGTYTMTTGTAEVIVAKLYRIEANRDLTLLETDSACTITPDPDNPKVGTYTSKKFTTVSGTKYYLHVEGMCQQLSFGERIKSFTGE